MSWLLGILLTMSSSVSPPSHSLLVFSFPDGARGGIGKIQGAGRSAYKDRWTFVPEDTDALLAGCGLKNAVVFDQRTHGYEVSAPSSSGDLQLVRCFKAKTYRHFNVGWGEINRLGIPEGGVGMPRILNDGPFRVFWREAQNPGAS